MLYIVVIAALLAACNAAANGDVAEFEQYSAAVEQLEKDIADLVKSLDSGIDCTVEINGGTAVVAISTPRDNTCDEWLVALKQRIVTEIKAQHGFIKRVSVNSTAGMLEKIYNPDDMKSSEEREIDDALKGNENNEIFDIAAPTL